ncbi:AraC family transcriptional regulator [Streptomyces olivaceus]|uniref:AraC family transcriptional regulator n=1 Tax=Streptomyces olivaceus TaxID=47716 RepID=UPI001CCD3193|nr:AraC family transcriptional regulator [Streptomyces olivaceus]MBZ6285760.1 AraC family transcriptional regulator [Streptomyces olivaceus]
MDLISEVIRTVRVGSAGARLIRQTDPRGLRFSAFTGSGFHIVRRGTCWLITEHGEPVRLGPGDVVLSSSGAAHGLSATPRALADLPECVMGPVPPEPGPADFEFLCGAYRFEHGGAPQYLRALMDLLAADIAAGTGPGTGATLPALLDLVLAEVLRQWHDEQDTSGRPRADDPGIAAALREIHENPQRAWTVDQLSSAAAMPRTAFTRRFTAVIGMPPMKYLTTWRLGRAARLLRESDAPLAAIARQVGYTSEFAFSAAFRREYGTSPGGFRRTPVLLAGG